MTRYGIFCFVILFLGSFGLSAQISADCSNAIPICNGTPINWGTNGLGVDDFNGAAQTGCLEQTISGTIESNSAWYRFRTGASGQLGFNIGFNSSEDWDFALYRTSDCNNLGDPIRCNFFDNTENSSFIGVGEDPTGATDSVQYEEWLQVSPWEDYYLLINNYSNINSGFSIQFSGNIFTTNPYDALDCSIVNNLLGPPIAACDNENVVLDATTANATLYNWYQDTGMGFQLLTGENNPTLNVVTSALYRVEVITPTVNIYSDVQVAFSPSPTAYAVSDDALCGTYGTYDLSQKNSEALGAQSPDEYAVSYHNSLVDATNGLNSLPMEYTLGVSGTETIYVRVTSIFNPRCFDATQQFQLTVVATPLVDFSTEIFLCDDITSTVIGDNTPDAGHTYLWDSGETTPTIGVSQAGTYNVTITNAQSGEVCENTISITVYISTTPEISEVLIDDMQENNTVTIVTTTEGDYEYQLDDGAFQLEATFTNVLPGNHRVTINDLNGCGALSEDIMVAGFPKYFSPNGDGVNDEWHIVGISELEDPIVYVFDRFGKLIKQMTNNDLGWDGTYNGNVLPSTDYWFKLTYLDSNGQRVEAKYVENHFTLRR